MVRLLRKFLLFYFVLVIFLPVVFAEDITITTYYPSPYGVYNTLRLYPNNNATAGNACANLGEMFYSQTSDQILICKGSVTSTWQSMAGAGESVMYLRGYNGGGDPATCPSGWTQADLQYEIIGGSYNRVRTCYYQNKTCQTMYLRAYNGGGNPANCPSGWTQADLKYEINGSYYNQVRSCYLCN